MNSNFSLKLIIFIIISILVLNNFISSFICTQIKINFNNNDKDIIVETLPSSFSWRDINGIDFSTPVKNQLPCPTCEAYALVSTIETLVQYQVGYPFGCDLSEVHLFFCSGGDADWGVDVKIAANYLVYHGVPDEGCSPDPQRYYETPCSNTLKEWENRSVKIEEWGWIENDIDLIKQALIEYGPLVICMIAYRDFIFYRGGIYKNTWGDRVGGHLITIFGYDDTQRYWLIKNSYGKNWGEEGWVRVSYDAHKTERPFFRAFYGGTGILYINGVYGNLQPDVPKIYIEKPIRGYNYFNNFSWKRSLLINAFMDIEQAIIIKGTTVEMFTSDDTRNVEIYLDNELLYNITSLPFKWYLSCETYGLHELKVIAYNNKNYASMDILDIFFIP